MKNYLVCSRKNAMLFFAMPMLIFALTIFMPIRSWLGGENSNSTLLFFAQNLFWLMLVPLLCMDVCKVNFGRSVWYAIGLATSVGAAFVIMLGVPVWDDYLKRVTFNSVAWKAVGANEDKPLRLRMVDDLLRTHRIEGLTRKEVDDLLGEPPSTNYFHNYDYVYWLGPERGFISIDSEWLCIKFSNGRAAKVRICRD